MLWSLVVIATEWVPFTHEYNAYHLQALYKTRARLHPSNVWHKCTSVWCERVELSHWSFVQKMPLLTHPGMEKIDRDEN